MKLVPFSQTPCPVAHLRRATEQARRFMSRRDGSETAEQLPQSPESFWAVVRGEGETAARLFSIGRAPTRVMLRFTRGPALRRTA